MTPQLTRDEALAQLIRLARAGVFPSVGELRVEDPIARPLLEALRPDGQAH